LPGEVVKRNAVLDETRLYGIGSPTDANRDEIRGAWPGGRRRIDGLERMDMFRVPSEVIAVLDCRKGSGHTNRGAIPAVLGIGSMLPRTPMRDPSRPVIRCRGLGPPLGTPGSLGRRCCMGHASVEIRSFA
jgi:hypothetical protein